MPAMSVSNQAQMYITGLFSRKILSIRVFSQLSLTGLASVAGSRASRDGCSRTSRRGGADEQDERGHGPLQEPGQVDALDAEALRGGPQISDSMLRWLPPFFRKDRSNGETTEVLS